MNIIDIDYSPNSTYFRRGDVEPDLKDDGLHIYNGRGSSRGWGQPGINSFIILNSDDVAAILVGFFTKHTGGQFWRYYVNGEKRTWAQLDECTQMAVLEAYKSKAPNWAKSPGMPKSKKAKPLTRMERENCIGYKDLVIKRDENEEIISIHSPSKHTEWGFDGAGWVLEAHELPGESNHAGVYVTFNAPVARAYSGELCKVMLSGKVVVGEKGARGQFARILEFVGAGK